MNKAFTLIELLVVVLIIGILSAIALPQYAKAVEKARLAEAITNIKAIETSVKEARLTNGDFSSGMTLKDIMSSVQLSGGSWDSSVYVTKNFEYSGATDYTEDYIDEDTPVQTYNIFNVTIERIGGKTGDDKHGYENSILYQLAVDFLPDGSVSKTCTPADNTGVGNFICTGLVSLGWSDGSSGGHH